MRLAEFQPPPDAPLLAHALQASPLGGPAKAVFLHAAGRRAAAGAAGAGGRLMAAVGAIPLQKHGAPRRPPAPSAPAPRAMPPGLNWP